MFVIWSKGDRLPESVGFVQKNASRKIPFFPCFIVFVNMALTVCSIIFWNKEVKLSYKEVLERRNRTFWMLMFAEYAYKCFFFQWEGRTDGKDFYRNWLTKDTLMIKTKLKPFFCKHWPIFCCSVFKNVWCKLTNHQDLL